MNPIPVADRIAKFVERTESCWLWKGYVGPNGYGMMSVNGRPTPAHRAVYEAFVGPIPRGLSLDHLCRVRACVNPAHLEPVSQGENIRRGLSPGAISVRTNKCFRGHEFSASNTRYHGDGGRVCRLCRREAKRAWLKKSRDGFGKRALLDLVEAIGELAEAVGE